MKTKNKSLILHDAKERIAQLGRRRAYQGLFVMAKQIQLNKGKFAIVDDADFQYLNQWKWQALIAKSGNVYAQRTYLGKEGKRCHEYMHRVLMPVKATDVIDHIDHDGLNNQRANLRICTQSQNLMNTKKVRGGLRYKGVYSDRGRYVARLVINGKQKRVGSFGTMEEAAHCYNKYALEVYGDFAYLNQVVPRGPQIIKNTIAKDEMLRLQKLAEDKGITHGYIRRLTRIRESTIGRAFSGKFEPKLGTYLKIKEVIEK